MKKFRSLALVPGTTGEYYYNTLFNIFNLDYQYKAFKANDLANAIEDRHPDHGKGAQLAIDACFLSGLRQIKTGDLPAWRPAQVYHYIQDRHIEPDFIVDVTDFVERKFECIKAYKTQFFDPNSTEPQTPISGEEFLNVLKGRMQFLGRTIGTKYAEGFTVERQIGVQSFFDLI